MPPPPSPSDPPATVTQSSPETATDPTPVAPPRIVLQYETPWTHPSWALEGVPGPETATQDDAARTMDSSWRVWARRSGRIVGIHRNLAIRWNPDDPRIGVAPSLALLEPPPATPNEALSSLCLWEPEHAPPAVALAVVSASHPQRDYFGSPRKHAAAGTGELWIFDPLRVGFAGEGRWRIQVWRRAPDDVFDRLYAGDGPAWSEFFGAWLVASEGGLRLRLSDDPEGRCLWPTEGEQADQERLAKEHALARLAECEARIAERRSGG